MSTSIRRAPKVMPYIVLGLFGLYTLEFGVVGVLPDIMSRYDVTAQQAGLLVGIFALTVAVTGPFLVLFSSRLDRKSVLVGALFGFAVLSAFSAIAPTFSVLMALRALSALLHPVFFATAFTAAASLYPPERRSHATSTAIIGTTLGLVVGVPATAWIATQISYEASFIFCAIVTAGAGLGLLAKLSRGDRAEPLTFRHQLSILRKAALWLNILATVLVLGMMFAVYSYAAEYLRSETGLDTGMISLLLAVFGVGGLLGNLLAGRLLARHLVGTVLIHPIALASAYLLLLFLSSNLIGPMSVIVLVWGAAHTSGLGITQMWLTSVAPEAPEFATSLYVSAANAGVVVGSAVGGVFITAVGIRGTIFGGLLLGAAALIVILIKIGTSRPGMPGDRSRIAAR